MRVGRHRYGSGDTRHGHRPPFDARLLYGRLRSGGLRRSGHENGRDNSGTEAHYLESLAGGGPANNRRPSDSTIDLMLAVGVPLRAR